MTTLPKTKVFDSERFLNKIHFNNERYSVPLSWKENYELIPDHYSNTVYSPDNSNLQGTDGNGSS